MLCAAATTGCALIKGSGRGIYCYGPCTILLRHQSNGFCVGYQAASSAGQAMVMPPICHALLLGVPEWACAGPVLLTPTGPRARSISRARRAGTSWMGCTNASCVLAVAPAAPATGGTPTSTWGLQCCSRHIGEGCRERAGVSIIKMQFLARRSGWVMCMLFCVCSTFVLCVGGGRGGVKQGPCAEGN
jgi:hypothetical protein